jgi:GNAT superfamily N-acetyltransferase
MNSNNMIVKVNDDNIITAAGIHSAAWQHSHKEFCSEAFVLLHTPIRQEAYLRNVISQGADLYMLNIENKAVGIVSICHNIIENLYVLPKEQNRGYGTQLLKYAISICSDNPTLWILNNNFKAQRFYERNGFQLTGQKKQLKDDLYEIEMKLSLTNE